MTNSTDILLTDVTNDDETGVFDVLMAAVNKHINEQYQEGRITASDYSSVYLGGIQSVLQQAVQYTLQEKVNEAQIALVYTERVLKDKQAAKLGLDNTMKLSEAARDADANFVYTPNYEAV